MSIRRRSCETCFRSRRKCDLTYPICERCDRNGKNCHYAYPPQLPASETRTEIGAVFHAPKRIEHASQRHKLGQNRATNHRDLKKALMNVRKTLDITLSPPDKIQRSLGILGELPTSAGTISFSWLFREIHGYPQNFAKHGETMFIHKNLYDRVFPRPLRAAFGICGVCSSLTGDNREMLFRAVEAEVSDLLEPTKASTLVEDLAKLQAAVLYQIIRLYYGGKIEQDAAEQQEWLVRSYGLALLRRSDMELENSPSDWNIYIMAESVRRTVVIAFKLYTVYSSYKYGICSELAAASMLPVSTKIGAWKSRDAFLQYAGESGITTYANFIMRLKQNPDLDLDLFETFLSVGCLGLGIQQIEEGLALIRCGRST